MLSSRRLGKRCCRRRPHAVWHALLSAHLHRMLIGACNPTLVGWGLPDSRLQGRRTASATSSMRSSEPIISSTPSMRESTSTSTRIRTRSTTRGRRWPRPRSRRGRPGLPRFLAAKARAAGWHLHRHYRPGRVLGGASFPAIERDGGPTLPAE